MTSSAARGVRSRLLFRRERRGDSERTDLEGELGGVEARTGGRPVLRGELEEAIARPVREHAEDVPEVALGIEVVQAARGDQGEQVARSGAMVIAADEQPALAANSRDRSIPPMSNFARVSSTSGTPRRASSWRFSTASGDGAKLSSFAECPTGRTPLCPRGCSTRWRAHE